MNEHHPTAADPAVRLRDVTVADLPSLYWFSHDPESNRMAAVKPRDRAFFEAHWTKVLRCPDTVSKVILLGDRVVGKISCFGSGGVNIVGYWIDRAYWGRGIATRALRLLLDEVTIRPLQARVAMTNPGSIRVLEKCGFTVIGREHSPETERYLECEEAILMLA
ncbi:MAG: GNAT family N-acetyltransferase [Phycisphaerales bacterium JB065]